MVFSEKLIIIIYVSYQELILMNTLTDVVFSGFFQINKHIFINKMHHYSSDRTKT
jgi:hypothetical protein